MDDEYSSNPPLPVLSPTGPRSSNHQIGLYGNGKDRDHGNDRERDSYPTTASRQRSSRDLSARELAKLLAFEEREAKDLHRILSSTQEQLKSETRRADYAESQVLEVARQFKVANDSRMKAEGEAARANVELKLYKNQLDIAQKEIRRAQQILDSVEAQRVKAEDDARKARASARRMREQRMVEIAREEGRRAGMQEGMEVGKDIGWSDGRREGYEEGRQTTERIVERVMREQPPPAPPPPAPPLSPDVLEEPMLNFEEGPERGLPDPPQARPPSAARSQNTAPAHPSPPLPPIPESEPVRNPPRRVHRPSSESSQSSQSTVTSLSRFDMLSAPGFRGRELSVIPEGPSPVSSRSGSREILTSTDDPPRSTLVTPQMTMPAPSVPTYSSAPQEQRSTFVQPQMSMPAVVIPNYEEGARPTNELYSRGRDSPVSSDDSEDVGTPSRLRPSLRRRRSGSSSSVPDITIEPPSRPESTRHSTDTTAHPHMLSPADAHRPIPLPQEPPQPHPGIPPPHTLSIPMTPAGTIRQVSDLPPGFTPTMPMAPPGGIIPSPGGTPRLVSELPPGFVSTSITPMTPGSTFRQVSDPPPGFLTSGSTVPVVPGMTAPNLGTTPSRPLSGAGRRTPGSMPGALAGDYFNSQPGSGGGEVRTVGFNEPQSPRSDPIRRATTPHPSRDRPRRPSDDSDSSSGSDDSLTTPPSRSPLNRRASHAGTPRNGYAVAPTPPGVTYPTPLSPLVGGTPRGGTARVGTATPRVGGAGSSTPFMGSSRLQGIPLPASTGVNSAFDPSWG